MFNGLNTSLEFIARQTQHNLPILAEILLIVWFAFFLTYLNKKLLCFGIFPRRIYGIPGILLAPLLHANFNHVFFNSIPLVVLSNFLLINGLHYFIWITLEITLASGFLIWCFGRPGLYVGASGVITGYWALLVSNIMSQGNLTAFILGVLSIYYFMGIFLGVFPGKKGVAWEGHLCGLLVGFAIGYLLY